MATSVKAGQVYEFRRNGLDLIMPQHCRFAKDGDLVQVVQLPSAPKPGTMNHTNIRLVGNPLMVGMCSLASLARRRKV